jgi:hypothetical protein
MKTNQMRTQQSILTALVMLALSVSGFAGWKVYQGYVSHLNLTQASDQARLELRELYAQRSRFLRSMMEKESFRKGGSDLLEIVATQLRSIEVLSFESQQDWDHLDNVLRDTAPVVKDLLHRSEKIGLHGKYSSVNRELMRLERQIEDAKGAYVAAAASQNGQRFPQILNRLTGIKFAAPVPRFDQNEASLNK